MKVLVPQKVGKVLNSWATTSFSRRDLFRYVMIICMTHKVNNQQPCLKGGLDIETYAGKESAVPDKWQ
jgi:hypothetical protein